MEVGALELAVAPKKRVIQIPQAREKNL